MDVDISIRGRPNIRLPRDAAAAMDKAPQRLDLKITIY